GGGVLVTRTSWARRRGGGPRARRSVVSRSRSAVSKRGERVRSRPSHEAVVAGLVDRGGEGIGRDLSVGGDAQGGRAAGDQLDLDARDALDLRDFLGHRVHAVVTGQAGQSMGGRAHLRSPHSVSMTPGYTPRGYARSVVATPRPSILHGTARTLAQQAPRRRGRAS